MQGWEHVELHVQDSGEPLKGFFKYSSDMIWFTFFKICLGKWVASVCHLVGSLWKETSDNGNSSFL